MPILTNFLTGWAPDPLTQPVSSEQCFGLGVSNSHPSSIDTTGSNVVVAADHG